jgi:iron uptake system component EfeO
VLAAVAAVVATALAGCSGAPADRTVAVAGTDTGCVPEATSIQSGVVAFAFTNSGSKENELYVLRPDGSIVGEREGVGPGTTATLTVEIAPGDYVLSCKPGMTGEGITTAIKVTAGAAATSAADPRVTKAVEAYRAYVADEVASTLATTKQLQAALVGGDPERARSLYAASRVGWERIEPVAESFGDLDPKIDLREADLEAGQAWTGWHVIEKGLWTGAAAGTGSADKTAAARTAAARTAAAKTAAAKTAAAKTAAAKTATSALVPVGEQLLADLAELQHRVPKAELTATSMANGAKELLDEVATGKVTGEEEAFSHTDLVDMQANVDGAAKVVDLLEPVLTDKDPALHTELSIRFDALDTLLDAHRTGEGAASFAAYTTITPAQRKGLVAAVDALAEPLSHLAAAVVK